MKTYEVTLKEVHSVVWRVSAKTPSEAKDLALQGVGDELVCDEYDYTIGDDDTIGVREL